MKVLIFAATVEGVASRADKTWKIILGSQEMGGGKVGEIADLAGKLCYVAIKPETFKDDEKQMIADLKTDFDSPGKTPSQRLRGVFYRIWEKKNDGYKDFNLYYEFHLEQLITHFKAKIDNP